MSHLAGFLPALLPLRLDSRAARHRAVVDSGGRWDGTQRQQMNGVARYFPERSTDGPGSCPTDPGVGLLYIWSINERLLSFEGDDGVAYWSHP